MPDVTIPPAADPLRKPPRANPLLTQLKKQGRKPNPLLESLVAPEASARPDVYSLEEQMKRSAGEAPPLSRFLEIPRQFVEDVVTNLGRISRGAAFWAIGPTALGERGSQEELPPIGTDPLGVAAMAQDFGALSDQGKRDAKEGAAFLASLPAGVLAEASPITATLLSKGASPLIAKGASFLTGEFLSGTIFGSIREKDPGETRLHAVLSDGAQFALLSGGLRALGVGTRELYVRALKRYVERMPSLSREAVMQRVKAQLNKAEVQLNKEGLTIDGLHPSVQEKLEQDAIQGAIVGFEEDLPLPAEFKVPFEEDLPVEALRAAFDAEVTGAASAKPGSLFEQQSEKEVKNFDKRLKATKAKKPSAPAVKPATGLPEAIQAVAVRGKSGKIYTGGASHPEVMNNAIAKGTPESEFSEGPLKNADHPDRGFVTDRREFVDRETGASIVGQVPRLFSEDVHAKKLLPHQSPEAADAKAKKIVTAAITDKEIPSSVKNLAAADVIMDKAVASTKISDVSTPPVNAAQRVVQAQRAVDAKLAEIKARAPTRPEAISEEDLAFFDPEYELEPGEAYRTPEGEIVPSDRVKKFLEDRRFAIFSRPGGSILGITKEERIAYDRVNAELTAYQKSKTPPGDWTRGRLSTSGTFFTNEEIIAARKNLLTKLQESAATKIAKGVIGDSQASELEAIAGLMGPKAIDAPRPAAATSAAKVGMARLRKKLAIKPDIVIPMHEQMFEEDALLPGDDRLINPKKMTGMEAMAHLDEKQLDEVAERLKNPSKHPELGAVTGDILAKLVLIPAGSLMEWQSANEDLEPWQRRGLRTAGSLLLLGAGAGLLGDFMRRTKFGKNVIYAFNPTGALTQGKEQLRRYYEGLNSATLTRFQAERNINMEFPTAQSRRALSFVISEGTAAPEFHALSASQQQAALQWRQLIANMGQIQRGMGRTEAFTRDHLRSILPRESFDRWETHGFGVGNKRVLDTRDLEVWASRQGVPGPILENPGEYYGKMLSETMRDVYHTALRAQLRAHSILDDIDQKAFPTGWRRIVGTNEMAPDEVALALENIKDTRTSSGNLLDAVNTLKGYLMHTIMFFAWEHGLNVLRVLPAVTLNPFSALPQLYAASKAIRALDPGLMDATNHGVAIFDRPETARLMGDEFSRLWGAIGLPRVGKAFDRFARAQERLLWDQWVPTMQYFVYMNELNKFTRRFPLAGATTPAYEAAARKAADFANLVVGRIPTYLANKAFLRNAQLLMFAPKWSTTRMMITANAFGELNDILAGKLNPRDAIHLWFKTRQVFAGVVTTYLMSKMLSGEDPEYNENTHRFYAKTGLIGDNGREIGVDLTGWWQQDNVFFADIPAFARSKLNPALEIVHEQLTGRDYFGRKMDVPMRLAAIAGQVGPLASIAGTAVQAGRIARGEMEVGEAVRTGLRDIAVGNVATFALPLDVYYSKMATRLLESRGVPATEENVMDLSKHMKANRRAGRPIIDEAVWNSLGWKRRSFTASHPIESEIEDLWIEARRSLASRE